MQWLQNMPHNLDLFGNYIITLKQQDDDNTVKKDRKSFTTNMTSHMNNDETESVLKTQMDSILNKMQTFEERDSGCRVTDIIRIDTNVNKHTTLKGVVILNYQK